MLKEEEWENAARLDEFNELRARWHRVMGTYPLMFLLDREGGAHEEMKAAVDRLEGAGMEPTMANWFATSRVSAL